MMTPYEKAALVAARELFGTADIEFDEETEFSHANDGVWVKAWCWVSKDEIEEDA